MIEDADVVINTMKIGTLDDPGLKLEVIRDFHGYFSMTALLDSLQSLGGFKKRLLEKHSMVSAC